MKKLLIILFSIVCVYFLAAYVQGKILIVEAEDRIQSVLPELARPWSVDGLRKNGSLALNATPAADIEERIDIAHEVLGKFIRTSSKPVCKVDRGVDSYSKSTFTYAICIVKVDFEKRSVGMDVRLVKQDGDWLLDDFSITKT